MTDHDDKTTRPITVDPTLPDIDGELSRFRIAMGRALPRELYEVLEGKRRWAVVHGEALAVLLAMPPACIDALITDPPYSSGGQYRGDRMKSTGEKYVVSGTDLQRPDFTGDNRSARAFLVWASLWLSEALRVAKPGAPGVVFSDWRQLATMADAFEAGGWVHRGTLVWDKTEATRPMLGRFRQQAEFMVWGSNGAMGAEREAMPCLPGVVRYQPKPSEKNHQTSKTPGTMLQVVPICAPGGVILDPFGGGGSTGVAALRLGYRVILVEMTAAYVEISRAALAAEERESTAEAMARGQASLFG